MVIAFLKKFKININGLLSPYLEHHRGLRRFSGHGLARVRVGLALEVLLHNLLVVYRSLKPRENVEAIHFETEDIAA